MKTNPFDHYPVAIAILILAAGDLLIAVLFGIGLLCLVGLFAGCANLAGDPSKMSADQLKAAARDKNASLACWNGKTAAGNVTTVYVNADQAPRLGSTVTIKADCETVLTTTSVEPAKAASAP